MSEIKVNKISPRTACGTTTLGDSGDTFNVPCGSKINLASGGNLTVASGATITNNGTQTGFGREGSVDWQTGSIKTGTFTAATAEGYFVNTSGGTATVNLPAGVAGSIVAISDYTRTFSSNNCTIAPNGSEKLGGYASDGVLDVDGQSATFVYVDGTEGWINVQETQTSQTGVPPYIAATGGTPACGTNSGDYKIHTFTGPGTFCVSKIATCSADNVVSYMVVAGGGSGAPKNHAGGGGAGGFREYKNSGDPYTASPLDGNPCGTAITVSASPYTITVGGGATATPGPTTQAGVRGANSVFSTITSTGGGGGSRGPGCGTSPGGSGGGMANTCGTSYEGAGNTPPVTPSQGFPGGIIPGGNGAPAHGAGGGGGASAIGGPGNTTQGGPGGAGVTTSINATPTARAGGGGGSIYCGPAFGTGGPGGGGDGGRRSPSGLDAVPGTINTGGGGGGAERCTPSGCGGNGGSGVVIIRYKFQ